MNIERAWAMPSGNTFTIPPIKALVERDVMNGGVIIDPFANTSQYGTITNDLNPEHPTSYHMDALEFLKMLPDDSADLVLFDPPYSITQASQLYKDYGKDKLDVSVANMKYWAMCKDNIARILKVGGVCISFGWNTNGVGIARGFEITDILIVAHGGGKNDTLCTREIKAIGNTKKCCHETNDMLVKAHRIKKEELF